MKNRFDLEQEILDTWKITNELRLINEALLDKNLSIDDISNMLIGLYTLYDLKFDQMFNTFETVVRNKEL